jgi:hypothetical protein
MWSGYGGGYALVLSRLSLALVLSSPFGPPVIRSQASPDGRPQYAIARRSALSGALRRSRLGSAQLSSAQLGSAQLGSARLGSARLGSSQCCNHWPRVVLIRVIK